MERQDYKQLVKNFSEDVGLVVAGEYGHRNSRWLAVKLTYDFDSGDTISRIYRSVNITYPVSAIREISEDFFLRQAFPAAEQRGETPRPENMGFRTAYIWEEF